MLAVLYYFRQLNRSAQPGFPSARGPVLQPCFTAQLLIMTALQRLGIACKLKLSRLLAAAQGVRNRGLRFLMHIRFR